MGLDITAYRGLTQAVGNEAFDEEGNLRDDDGWIQFYLNHEFPHRADDIKDRHAYKAEAEWGFCAGGYGDYSWWRNELAQLAGYPLVEYEQYGKMWPSYAAAAWEGSAVLDASTRPFYELINFSDCEGTIGAAVSAKLASDFAAFQDKADAHPDDRFRTKYSDWRHAFEMASDRGAVVFH